MVGGIVSVDFRKSISKSLSLASESRRTAGHLTSTIKGTGSSLITEAKKGQEVSSDLPRPLLVPVLNGDTESTFICAAGTGL